MSAAEIAGRYKPLAVRYIEIGSLKPAPRNARTHSPQQIQQLTASIREFGWTNPILIDEQHGIIAGHGRVQAAREAGLAEVPTIALTGLSAAQKRALVIADNKLALNAGWDEDILRAELGELGADGFDLSMIGFSDAELAAILDTTAGLTDPDDAPEVQAEAVSRPGDLWLLGRHRLLCGDCTDAETAARAMGGAKPHLMVTDPPYGVDYDPDWRNQAPSIGWSRSRSIGTVPNDKRSDWRDAWALFPGDVVYAWHPPGAMQINHHEALVVSGFDVRMQIIWAKSHFPVGRGNYHVQHEPCWYAVRKGKTAHWQGDRKQTTLWEIANSSAFRGGMIGPEDIKSGHSTQKPVECMRRPIENNSRAGDAVYDPFVGSGTTIIAAEMTGRACIALEVAPQYVDVAVRRWQTFTGHQATHEDGRLFDDIAAEAADAEAA